MKRKLRLTKRQGILWSVGLLALGIALFEAAGPVFGIRWDEIGVEQAGMVCVSLGGLLVAYALWLAIKTRFKLGEPYSTMREELKVLRAELRRMERSGGNDRRFRRTVKRFNECARALRLPEYEIKARRR